MCWDQSVYMILEVQSVSSYRKVVVEVVESGVTASCLVSHCEASPRRVKRLDEAWVRK